MDHSQFLTKLENHSDPLISFKDLITDISNYTNKTPSKIADELETLLFGFRQNGVYTNAFCYCTILDKSGNKREIYEPIENNFQDAFNLIKGYLKEVIFANSTNVENIDKLFVRRSEIVKQIQMANLSLLGKVEPVKIKPISQVEEDYISLYELIEWAKSDYADLSATAKDLLRLLDGKEIQLYRHYTGIKKSIDKDNQRLDEMLDFVKRKNGYQLEILNNYDDIPF